MTDEAPCIFCDIAQRKAPARVVLETEASIAFFDAHPHCAFHTLVIPKVHCPDLLSADAETLSDLTATVQAVCARYRERLGIEDFQVICSSGAAAQQDVFHLHFHVLPRRPGDGKDLAFANEATPAAVLDERLARVR